MSADGEASASPAAARRARLVAVQDDVVTLAPLEAGARLVKNEVVFLEPSAASLAGARLQGEILRVRGGLADVQVFESTIGLAVGDSVTLSGAPLSAVLGPGLLGQVFDGLQTPLEPLAAAHGAFLPRGRSVPALAPGQSWPLHAVARAGATVQAGDPIGWVEEGQIRHVIFAPFNLAGPCRVLWIEEAAAGPETVIGELADAHENRIPLRLTQRWPIRASLAQSLIQRGRARRLYPTRPLVTTQRIIDTFFPVAQGGTACIPGPFGAGKTILQNLIARFCEVDIVVVVACGERAGEVVEMMGEFQRLRDPRGGRALMERTIILCNTSAMPVAAREASIHMGATIAEYYRAMGLEVLLLADSTSRWAQALRETSGRLEQIPGEDAYPASLASEIKAFYERAGVVSLADGTTGSLTMIGAVSPAGGNFEEPVTQATLSTVKCFLGLSAERAYRRAYPAIDPLQSWSRYHDQIAATLPPEAGPDWAARVAAALAALRRGEAVAQLMKVAGDDGVSDADALARLKAEFLDAVFLQQDAFDAVDASCPFAAQVASFARVERVLAHPFAFESRDDMRAAFARLTALAKAINLAAPGSPDHAACVSAFEAALS